MRRRPFPNDEELFRSSTMSFGEHLEELRRALILSSVGFALALAVTFPCAKYAVRFVEGPLERALVKYYRLQAQDEMLKKSAGTLSAAEWRLLFEKQLIPRRVQMDVSSLRTALNLQAADWDQRFADPSLEISRSDLRPADAVVLARQLVAAADSSGTNPVAIIAKTCGQQVQKDLALQLEDSKTANPEKIRQTLVKGLNECILAGELAEVAPVRRLTGKLPVGPRAMAEGLLSIWEEGHRDDVRVQLNRLLISAVFPDLVPLPRSRIAELTIWEPGRARIQTLGVPEAFMAWMKAWMVLAALVAAPWIFYQLWLFVAAGLYGHERSFVYTFLPFSLILFLAGAALAFGFVFDPVLDFLFGFNRKLNINIEPRFSDWIGFVLLLPLGFGISFQLPLVMLLLERVGIVSVATYISRWRISILVIFVVSMVLTPADPISMLLMAIPLSGLYFGGILLCRWFPRPPADAPVSAPQAREDRVGSVPKTP